jgi:hypothetical protein
MPFTTGTELNIYNLSQLKVQIESGIKRYERT